ncbi:hypothetical protein HDV00_005722 [Rhizophlyctis rosea]|nr:hypothetical protein HDV00_005722 [Rhizophlyctis rosea]
MRAEMFSADDEGGKWRLGFFVSVGGVKNLLDSDDLMEFYWCLARICRYGKREVRVERDKGMVGVVWAVEDSECGTIDMLAIQRTVPPRLYDLDRKRVISPSPDFLNPWICVSHVWATTSREATDTDGVSWKIPLRTKDKLPNMVDKLHEAKSRGLFAATHVWIDVLCIDQDSIHDQEVNVSRMTEYFSNGLAVIVWLEPDLPRHPLDPTTLPTTPIAATRSIWSKRVWCLQEGMLARKLFFYDTIAEMWMRQDELAQIISRHSSVGDWRELAVEKCTAAYVDFVGDNFWKAPEEERFAWIINELSCSRMFCLAG